MLYSSNESQRGSYCNLYASSVGQKGTIPGFNIVGLWACSTLAGDNTDPLTAYGISGSDQALIGFGSEANTFTYAASEWPTGSTWTPPASALPSHKLGDHATSFFQGLVAGKTAQEALTAATASYQPMYGTVNEDHSVTWHRLDMILKGDRFATLKYVYLSENERATLRNETARIATYWVQLPVKY